jgi:hypothetical protein
MMKLLDDNVLAEVEDETKTPGESGEDEKDFLSDLEEMAKEVEDDPNSID